MYCASCMTEMANTVPADSALSAILVNETIPSVNTCCSNCVLLNLKLEEIYSELSSACEIIKILQEESSLIQYIHTILVHLVQ